MDKNQNKEGKIDIPRVCAIVEKGVQSQEDWGIIKSCMTKIASSSKFAHKCSKTMSEILNK